MRGKNNKKDPAVIWYGLLYWQKIKIPERVEIFIAGSLHCWRNVLSPADGSLREVAGKR